MPNPHRSRENPLSTVQTADDFACLTLDSRGMICDCNATAESLFKAPRSTVILQHVSLLLPELAEMELMPNCEVNPQLRFLCRIGCSFQAVNQHGERFPIALIVRLLDSAGYGKLSLIVRPFEASGEHPQTYWEGRCYS
jgi:PAS domain-containing protein